MRSINGRHYLTTFVILMGSLLYVSNVLNQPTMHDFQPASQQMSEKTIDERAGVVEQPQTSHSTLPNASNSSNIQSILDIPANPNPTCQRLQETFGVDFAAVSAPHAWSSHIDLLLERSQLPEDKKFKEKDRIEWVLRQIPHRLPRGVQHSCNHDPSQVANQQPS